MSERVLAGSKFHSPLSSDLRDSSAQSNETITQRPAWSYCTKVDEANARNGNFWPRSLAFILTYKCNVDCSICGIKNHEVRTAELPVDVVYDMIDQAVALGIKNVCFTGGEALAMYKDIFRCANYAHSKGIEGSVVTNAYYAKNTEASLRMTSKLVGNGVTELNISVDKDHADSIPLIYVANAISVALAQAMNVRLLVTDRTSTKSENDRLLGELAQRLSGKIEAGIPNSVLSISDVIKIYIERGRVERSGNADKLEDDEFVLKKLGKDLECPAETIVVKPDKNGGAEIIPCCSFPPLSRGFFSLGNTHDTTLKTAIERMNNSILGAVVHGVSGFERVRNVLRNSGNSHLAYLADGEYISLCDACATIFSDSEAAGYLTQIFNSFCDATPSVAFSKGAMASEESAQVMIKKGDKEETIKFSNYIGPLSNTVYMDSQLTAELARIEELEKKYGINLQDSKSAIQQLLSRHRRA